MVPDEMTVKTICSSSPGMVASPYERKHSERDVKQQTLDLGERSEAVTVKHWTIAISIKV